jgi:ribosomal protein S18 acetylase RimI-like enzyme
MEAFRNKGIGTQLIVHAEETLRLYGFTIATIAVSKTNYCALRLYTHLGYRTISDDAGRWQYIDDKGVIRHVHDPCWILEKHVKIM